MSAFLSVGVDGAGNLYPTVLTAYPAAATSDVAATGITITSQAPYASASSNVISGNIILNTPAVVSGNARPTVQVQYAGTQVIGMGYGAASSTPTVFFGTGTSNNISYSGGFNFALSGTNYATITSSGLTASLYTTGAQVFGIGAGFAYIFNAAGSAFLYVSNGDVSYPYTLTFYKNTASPGLYQLPQTTDVATINTTIAAQSAYASATTNTTGGNLVLYGGNPATSTPAGAGGSVIVNVAAPASGTTEAGLQIQRAGVKLATLQALIGATTDLALYGNVTPSASNYALVVDTAGNGYLNGLTSANLQVAGAQKFVLSSASATFQSGVALTVTAAQFTCIGGQVNLAQINGTGSAPVQFGGSSVTLATSGTTTLSSAQSSTAALTIAPVTLVGAATLAFGNVGGAVSSSSAIFFLDISGINAASLATYGLTLSNGTGTITLTSTQIAAAGGLILVKCNANAITIGSGGALLSAGISFPAPVSAPVIQQLTQTSDVAVNAMTIAAQSAYATATSNPNGANLLLNGGNSATSTGAGGNVVLNGGTGGTTPGYVVFESGGSQLGTIQEEVGTATQFDLYLTGSTAPSTNNPALSCTATSTVVNAASILYLQIGRATTYMTLTGGSISPAVPITISHSEANPTWSQATASPDAATQNWTLQAQSAEPGATVNVTGGNLVLAGGNPATANGIGGSVVVNVAAPTSTATTEAAFNFERAGTSLIKLQALVGNATYWALYGGGVTPSSTNYSLGGDTANSAIYMNAATNAYIAIGGTAQATFGNGTLVLAASAMSSSAAVFGITTPFGGATSLPFKFQDNNQTLAASGTTTLSAGGQAKPSITFAAVTLTAPATFAFGSIGGAAGTSAAFFDVDCAAVNLNGQSLTFTNGTGTFNATTILGIKTLLRVKCSTNYINVG